MSNIDKFKAFSLNDLKLYLTLIESFETKDDMHNALIAEIKRREEEAKLSLNARFTIEMFKSFNMFYPDEMSVLEINGIRNLQDLIEADLNSMIGMTESIKEKLSWARRFYNLETSNGKVKKKNSNVL